MTTLTSTPTAVTAPEARTLRRAGWWLIGSFLGFLVGLVVSIVQLSASGTETAAQEAADRLGVGVDDLPSAALAEIYSQSTWLSSMLAFVPIVLAGVAFAIGVRAAATVAPATHRWWARAATSLGVGCGLVLFGMQVLSALIELAYLPVGRPTTLLVMLTCAVGGAAMVALVPVLRARDVARRTGIVVAVLGVLSVLACFVLPPFLPFLLAVILGVVLVRSRPSATM